MHPHLSDAIVLRHLDYGEADRVVTFLTPDQGVLKGFARGARKSRRRFGAALELFASVRLHWTAGRGGGMASLREAELVDLRPGLRADLAPLALAGYGCELVEELLGEGPVHAEAFGLLRAFLDHLAAGGGGEAARLLFELRLLAASGYVPHLLHCAACGGALEEEAGFDPGRGGPVCFPCGGGRLPLRVAAGTLGSLARCLQTPPELFEGIRLGPRTLAEGSAVLGASLRPHLRRPLRSLAFLEEVAAPAGGSEKA